MGHGYRWEEYFKMDRDAEREAIRKAVESIAKTTGQRPLGWYTRYGPSVNTRDLVVEEGGFLYDCNSYADDLPFYTSVGGKPWLVVPYSLEVNDTKYWRGGMANPNDFYDAMRNTFDLLYEEGATHPKMMSIGLHCRIVGKPARAAVLKQFLEYAASRPRCLVCPQDRHCSLVAGQSIHPSLRQACASSRLKLMVLDLMVSL